MQLLHKICGSTVKNEKPKNQSWEKQTQFSCHQNPSHQKTFFACGPKSKNALHPPWYCIQSIVEMTVKAFSCRCAPNANNFTFFISHLYLLLTNTNPCEITNNQLTLDTLQYTIIASKMWQYNSITYYKVTLVTCWRRSTWIKSQIILWTIHVYTYYICVCIQG